MRRRRLRSSRRERWRGLGEEREARRRPVVLAWRSARHCPCRWGVTSTVDPLLSFPRGAAPRPWMQRPPAGLPFGRRRSGHYFAADGPALFWASASAALLADVSAQSLPGRGALQLLP